MSVCYYGTADCKHPECIARSSWVKVVERPFPSRDVRHAVVDARWAILDAVHGLLDAAINDAGDERERCRLVLLGIRIQNAVVNAGES